MNDREMAICRRVADLRRRLGWSQSQLALAVGTTRDQLATIEYGRNPLRYWLADRLCEKFDVCQQWLASGEGPLPGYVKISPEIALNIRVRELFSAAYDRCIGHFVRQQVSSAEQAARAIAGQASAANALLQDRLYNLAVVGFQRIPPELYQEYYSALMAATVHFLQTNKHRFPAGKWPPAVVSALPSAIPQGKKYLRQQLTDASISEKLVRVRSLKTLLAEARRLAKIRGTKTWLAKKLGVAPETISRYLSGKIEPGGNAALTLLDWVESRAQNPNKNTADSAINTASGKAQERQSSEPKPIKGQKKPSHR